MEATTDRNQWWEDAACKGDPVTDWVFSVQPTDTSKKVDTALSTCAVCPVVLECRRETARTLGAAPHTFQVRGGLRLWVEEDTALLEEQPVLTRCESCRRAFIDALYCPPSHKGRTPGQSTGAIPATRGSGGSINPHVRGPHNTPTPEEHR